MTLLAQILVLIVALLHAYFLVLEMFLWTTPTGRRVFGLDAEFAEQSKALAAKANAMQKRADSQWDKAPKTAAEARATLRTYPGGAASMRVPW